MFDPNPTGARAGPGLMVSRARRRRAALAAAFSGILALTAFAAGRTAGSHALQAAALVPFAAALAGLADRLGGAPMRVRRGAMLARGGALAAAGLAVLGGTVPALVRGAPPSPVLMGGVALAILGAHVASLLLLLPDREEGRRWPVASACQGAIAQAFVAVAALCVRAGGSDWPDLVVAANLAALSLLSALQIVRRAAVEWRTREDQGALASHGFHEDFA